MAKESLSIWIRIHTLRAVFQEQRILFLQLFNNHSKECITVELIENSEINDAKMSLEMIEVLSLNKIRTAIDDVFGQHSMLSFEVIQLVDYVKLDKHVCPQQR